MTFSHRNIADEQQEACQKARQIIAICGQFNITLDPIDWQQFGMLAPVKVNNIDIASLLTLGQCNSDDILRQVQITLFAHAALENLSIQGRPQSLHVEPCRCGAATSVFEPLDHHT